MDCSMHICFRLVLSLNCREICFSLAQFLFRNSLSQSGSWCGCGQEVLFRGKGSTHRVALAWVTWGVPECWCGFSCPFRGSNHVQKHTIGLLQQFNLRWPMLLNKTMWLPRRVWTPPLFVSTLSMSIKRDEYLRSHKYCGRNDDTEYIHTSV